MNGSFRETPMLSAAKVLVIALFCMLPLLVALLALKATFLFGITWIGRELVLKAPDLIILLTMGLTFVGFLAHIAWPALRGLFQTMQRILQAPNAVAMLMAYLPKQGPPQEGQDEVSKATAHR